jgi:hypothetical protein
VFDETEFPNWEGSTPTGKKQCRNCTHNHTNNNTDKTKDYATIATTASDEQTKIATKILSLIT